jgi:hypothetical protein
MTILKSLENSLGKTELRKYDDIFVVTLKSESARLSKFQEYRYKSDAVQTYQFNCYWLEHNCKEGK